MLDLKKLEEFIVNADDVINLMEIYATRIKSYPENRAYYGALSLQCGEFLLATKQLESDLISRVAQHLHQMIKLLDEKGIDATNRQMEVFIEEIQDLTRYLKSMFRDQDDSLEYSSQNLSLLTNFIRQLAAQEANAAPARTRDDDNLVEDPFDEIEGLGDFVDSIVSDLDDAFDSIIQPQAKSEQAAVEGQLALSDREQTEVEKLFLSISGAYVQPVKEFISELRDGSANKSWIDTCLGSLKLIEDAGTKMSYEQISRIIERFKKLMLQAKYSTSTHISREIRIQLLKEYANLSQLLPEAFATSDTHASRGTLRDTIIINAILRKTPGVGTVSRNKLIAAGMNSLDKYFVASPRDLAAVSGLNDRQATAICETFAMYRESIKLRTNMTTQTQVSLTKLYKHLRVLKDLHEKYKEVTRRALYSTGFEDQQNQLRLDRQKCMWEINIILAELNALRLVEDFRKMVFDRRIQRLDEFLETELKKAF